MHSIEEADGQVLTKSNFIVWSKLIRYVLERLIDMIRYFKQ